MDVVVVEVVVVGIEVGYVDLVELEDVVVEVVVEVFEEVDVE